MVSVILNGESTKRKMEDRVNFISFTFAIIALKVAWESAFDGLKVYYYTFFYSKGPSGTFMEKDNAVEFSHAMCILLFSLCGPFKESKSFSIKIKLNQDSMGKRYSVIGATHNNPQRLAAAEDIQTHNSKRFRVGTH